MTGDPLVRPDGAANADTTTGTPPVSSRLPGTREAPPPGADPQVWRLLCNCRALETLSAVTMQELWAAATERSCQAGEALVIQGDAAEGLWILLEGTAHALLRGPDGQERCIGRFTSGDVVGEMALVTREPRSATVVADSPIRALLVPTAAFDRLAARHLELSLVLTELVADRLGRGAHDGFGGKRVEGFRIRRCIGRGGMSVVYGAYDESSGVDVALKMMSYRLIYDGAALARFHQEAAIVQRLDHENIARLQRLFQAYGTYFLVMELCDGVDLQRLVQATGPLTESQVRPILGQLARALEYVHGRGLVHRDLKPGNVMVTRRGEVKLTDFGIAVPEVVLADAASPAPHVVVGTLPYMAPEQLAGGPVDRRADVYALGCLAYELLTGHRLFSATSIVELIERKRSVQVPSAPEIGAGIGTALHAFLEGALRPAPAERPASLARLVEWAAPCDPVPGHLVDTLFSTQP